ncbi:Amidase related to nicotinamidase [Halalkaliarchaeum sp. AArc-CO]|uniref:isochorismatase family protein n=1 Tax=Halalkaliarchaeum sp. AArc-CO TaxID=2866381 RepID=UPI00217DD671|nr:isochorismatase family protein [Halalkaliarchaeum sp. AArc-CO]UWG50196.1 Amidase related to nicotinamidase [Halalkaliarchaeum sp. AArc-CO]
MNRNGAYYVPDVIPDSDLEYFETEGETSRTAAWGDSPAVLVVDLTLAFIEERPEVSQPCVESTAELLATARDVDVPVVYAVPTPAGTYPREYRKPTIRSVEGTPDEEHRQWVEKLDEIPPEVEPQESEQVFEKPRASAFFDTHLSNYLHHYGIDTLIICGMSTSGCVRATVVDGHSSNFRMIVPPECVADRSVVSHEVSLFDMEMKYADVTPLLAVTDRLQKKN